MTIDITFPRDGVGSLASSNGNGSAGNSDSGAEALLDALDRICGEVEKAIDDGFSLVVLSDRGVSHDRIPLPTLLACGAVHHHLVRQAKRTRIGLVVESGEAREVHHHCLLVGYGADAINPYLAFESLWQARRDDLLNNEKYVDDDKVVEAYRKGGAQRHAQGDGQNGNLDIAVV